MTDFRRRGDRSRRRYAFSSPECLGATCWAPGLYESRWATMSGSRNTGNVSAECIRRAHHGWPVNVVHSDELVRTRKAEGWVRG